MNNDTEKHVEQTIKEATDVDLSAEQVKKREERIDAELGYEALALTASMGVLGMEETNANLLQLEFAEQRMRKTSLDENDEN